MAVTVSNLQNFIDGEFVASPAGATDPVINPATGEEIGQAASSDAADVDRAVKAATKAFETWAARRRPTVRWRC